MTQPTTEELRALQSEFADYMSGDGHYVTSWDDGSPRLLPPLDKAFDWFTSKLSQAHKEGDCIGRCEGYEDGYAVGKANQHVPSDIIEAMEKLKRPMEDDEEVYLYRHCAEGDHWKCGGDGDEGRCVCRCHAISKCQSIVKKYEGEV